MTFGLKNAVLDQLDDQLLKWTLPQASGPAFLLMLNITLAIRSTSGVKGLMTKKEKRGSLTMKVVGKSLKLYCGSKRKTVGNSWVFTQHITVQKYWTAKNLVRSGGHILLKLGGAVYFQTRTSSFIPKYCSLIVYELNTSVWF